MPLSEECPHVTAAVSAAGRQRPRGRAARLPGMEPAGRRERPDAAVRFPGEGQREQTRQFGPPLVRPPPGSLRTGSPVRAASVRPTAVRAVPATGQPPYGQPPYGQPQYGAAARTGQPHVRASPRTASRLRPQWAPPRRASRRRATRTRDRPGRSPGSSSSPRSASRCSCAGRRARRRHGEVATSAVAARSERRPPRREQPRVRRAPRPPTRGRRPRRVRNGIPPATVPPDGLGDDPALDAVAQNCYEGDMESCDALYGRPRTTTRWRPTRLRRHVRRAPGGRHVRHVYCTDAFPATDLSRLR